MVGSHRQCGALTRDLPLFEFKLVEVFLRRLTSRAWTGAAGFTTSAISTTTGILLSAAVLPV